MGIGVRSIGLCVALLASSTVLGDEKEELLKVRETLNSLLDALVDQGVLTRAKAEALIKQAARKGEAAARAAAREAAARPIAPEPAEEGVVRVPYVPEVVKKEIRQEVRRELKSDVTNEVMAQAKKERWGVPAALPDWLSRIKFSGDTRVRGDFQFFDEDNAPFIPDPLAVNEAGRVFGADEDVFFNTTEDRQRLRVRARVGLEAEITENIKTGFRLTTGDQRDPVSANQTLGNEGRRYEVQLDTAFLNYSAKGRAEFPWLDVWLGRFSNPWFGTELVWDEDLTFEGAAATYRYNLASSSKALQSPHLSRNLMLTAGAFPIDEISLSGQDKWLFGGQLGFEWGFKNQSSLKLGVGYYDYVHTTGRRNGLDSNLLDFTAPEFLQKGNTLFNIRNSSIDPDSTLLALASDYDLLNVTGQIDLAFFDPIRITLTGDVVKNLGYDRDQIFERTAQGRALFPFVNVLFGCVGIDCIQEETLGYNLQLGVGWPKITQLGNWRVTAAYRNLERDAVLDAFTDSDFNLGGTDAEGWIVTGYLGLASNTWLRLRYFSTHEIEDNVFVAENGDRFVDGPALGLDQLFLDLNVRFF